MDPGLLDRRLTIQTPLTQRDSAGGMTTGHAAEVTVWARKLEQGGSEYRAAGYLQAETTTLFTIRWREGVTPACRLLCEGKEYDIVSIAEQGRRELLLIQAKGRKAP